MCCTDVACGVARCDGPNPFLCAHRRLLMPSLYVALQDIAASRSWLVRAYYSHRLFMGFCCIACEVLYLAIYCLAWPQFQQPVGTVQLPSSLTTAARQTLDVASLSNTLVERVLDGPPFAQPLRVPAAVLLATAAVPGWAVKQVCNWLQLRMAMRSLVELDLKRRC